MLDDQQRLLTDVGYIDRGNRGVIRISGPDRLEWLHSLTTQDLAKLPAWTGAETLILSPNGHIEHHLVLTDDGESMWADVEPDTANALVSFLDSMRFLLRVEVVNESDKYSVVSLVGPRTDEVVGELIKSRLDEPYAAASYGTGFVRRMPWPGPRAADVVVPRAEVAQLLQTLETMGVQAATEQAFEALRVAAHHPRLGWETDHRTLPHEVGWIGTAVHVDKGCYRGQETVARVHNLGRPPRRLVFLTFPEDGGELARHGEPVLDSSGAEVGFIGTAVQHVQLGAIALALVKRTAALEGLRVGGV